ncbi:MAG: nucleotidyltransferase domain-containing protein [Oscillospiraceae bacterium]|nr:nucleotidyltransferase domain-containing protein [Oscillospiraceae bacterium]
MRDILTEISGLSQSILGEKLTGVYLHGSMTFGCYNPLKSDIDFIVVVNMPVSAKEKVEYVAGLIGLENRTDSPK